MKFGRQDQCTGKVPRLDILMTIELACSSEMLPGATLVALQRHKTTQLSCFMSRWVICE